MPRGNHDEIAGVKQGAKLVDRFIVNVGTISLLFLYLITPAEVKDRRVVRRRGGMGRSSHSTRSRGKLGTGGR